MFLITGATGTIGRAVTRLLLARGAEVTAVTRDPDAGLPPAVRRIHPDDLTGLGTLEGVLISPRATAGTLGDVLARKAERAVLLSAVTVQEPAGYARFREEFQRAERAVLETAPAWTVLRCTDFAANALSWAGRIRAGAGVHGAYAGARTSTVDERDVAAVAALALTEPDHAGHTYVLTGEESLTQADRVAAIGAAIGRPLEFTEVAPEDVRRGLLAAGLPGEVPDRLLGSLADYARRPGPTTDTVRRLLGRPATTFSHWAADHRAAFTA
ncbi:NmrA family NAD(P)-binding protein [Actinoplanes sp. NPDC051851]|uniref:NAD-dependent epimerase/dehydratase family protein n=1 Tax=Actinoplanes sp. NPDC051851 TaxID=3154753 RepID=UPI0034492FC3